MQKSPDLKGSCRMRAFHKRGYFVGVFRATEPYTNRLLMCAKKPIFVGALLYESITQIRLFCSSFLATEPYTNRVLVYAKEPYGVAAISRLLKIIGLICRI